jgi:hypothetical protein
MLRRVALVRTTWRNIPADTILHSHRRENLISYIILIQFYLHSVLVHSANSVTISTTACKRVLSSAPL